MPTDPLSLLGAASTAARLVQPVINDLYDSAKKAGAKGLLKWGTRNFATKLAKRVFQLEQVRTIWKPDTTISIREFFHPPRLVVDGQPRLLTRLSQLPSSPVVIQGIVGQGKSVLLRSLAVESLRSNESARLPVFIELKDLNQKIDLEAAIRRQLKQYDISVDEDPQTLPFLLREGKICLLLDGFDELEESIIKPTFLDIEQLCAIYPDLPIVVTSRPRHEIQKSSRFQVLEIADLMPAEYGAFLSKLKVHPDKSVSLRQAIKNSPSKISDLITTPLMLTLVVIVYEAESQIPETLPEFFERLFQVVFTRHDHLKAAFTRKHHSGLSERRLQSLFEAFCFAAIQNGNGRTLTQVQFDAAFDVAASYTEDIVCESEKFKRDITKVACLMLEEGIDSISFLHKSIVEYYAAAFVRKLSEENALLFYEAAIPRSRLWAQTLVFLKSIDTLRYSKYYLGPAIRQETEEVLEPSDGVDDSALIALTTRLYPGHGVYFSVKATEPGKAMVNAFGGRRDRTLEDLGDLGGLITDALMRTVPMEIARELLWETFQVDPANEDDRHGAHVPLSRLFEEYGAKELRIAYGIFRARLEQHAANLSHVEAREEKMRLMFTKTRSAS